MYISKEKQLLPQLFFDTRTSRLSIYLSHISNFLQLQNTAALLKAMISWSKINNYLFIIPHQLTSQRIKRQSLVCGFAWFELTLRLVALREAVSPWVPSSKDGARVFVGRNHHIKFNPPNPDSLNPVPWVYSHLCMRVYACMRGRVHTAKRIARVRSDEADEGRTKWGVLAYAIDSQAGSQRDNVGDEGPPK